MSALAVLALVLPLVVISIVINGLTREQNLQRLIDWCKSQRIENAVVTPSYWDCGPYWVRKHYSIYKVEGTKDGKPVLYYARKGWGWELQQKTESGEYVKIEDFQI